MMRWLRWVLSTEFIAGAVVAVYFVGMPIGRALGVL